MSNIIILCRSILRENSLGYSSLDRNEKTLASFCCLTVGWVDSDPVIVPKCFIDIDIFQCW